MNEIITYILEPLSFAFIHRALLLGTMIGIICAILSCFLVLKGWALMGDAISHAVLPGIIISYLLGLPLALGAFVAGTLSTIGIGFLKKNTRLKEDSSMGIIFSVMFALGLFLFGIIETKLHLTHILFGNVLGIEKTSLLYNLLFLICILIVLIAKGRDLVLFCFDPIQMKILGKSVFFHHYLLLGLLSFVIVISVQAVGILFVVALLIIPGMFGFALTKQFMRMVFFAIGFSVLTIIIGILVSFYLDLATAPLIVVLQTFIMVSVLIIMHHRKVFSTKASSVR